MALEIFEDLIAGTSYSEDDRGGDYYRVFHVRGLPSTNKITENALRAGVGAVVIPSAGQKHPTMAELICRSIKVDATSRTSCKIVARYVKVRRRLMDIRLNGTSVMQPTRMDKDGKRLWVAYKPGLGAGVVPPDPPDDPTKRDNWIYDPVTLQKLTPDTVLEIVYMEPDEPMSKAKKYVRRANKTKWNGGDIREWVCISITGNIDSPIPINISELGSPEVIDGKCGLAKFNWLNTYTFRYNPKPSITSGIVSDTEGWDPVAIFIDRQTGSTKVDIDPLKGGWPKNERGNGWAICKLYSEADFAELNLVQFLK